MPKKICPHPNLPENKFIGSDGKRRCRLCRTEAMRNWYRKDLRQAMWHSAKTRSKKEGLPFNITKDDIYIPMICPILGIPLKFKGGQQYGTSPSLDKIIPELGYVKGNVAVISSRANMIKSDATAEQHRRIARFMDRTLYDSETD